MNNKQSIFSLTYEELLDFITKANLKPYLARQIFSWIYKKHVYDFDLMTNVSKKNIEFLKQHFYFNHLTIDKCLISDDETTKFLFKLKDGNKIESIIMKFDYDYSLCVTTQVGCNMGCKFCASGQLKKIRNLTADEIVLQVVTANDYLLKQKNKKIRNIVVMGIGEPLDNYENLKSFLNIVRNDYGIGIGSRKITVSTCGLINKFPDFVKDFSQVGLAISLHAPNDEIRNSIMPINNAYNISKLIDAAKDVIKKTNRRITFEYIMIKGINDGIEHANQLGRLLKNLLCYVNLIPYNEVDNTIFKRSNNIKPFINELKKYNLIVTVRQEKGNKINGACGQLRAQEIKD